MKPGLTRYFCLFFFIFIKAEAVYYIASGSEDKYVKIWNANETTSILSLFVGDKVRVVKFLHDIYLASASNDLKLRIWDLKNGVCVRTLVDSDEQSSKMNFFSIDLLHQNILVSASTLLSISYVIVWNYMNGTQLNKYKISESIEKVEVIQKDFLVIAGKNLHLWNLTTDKIEKFNLIKKSTGLIKFDNEIVMVATAENISVWNLTSRSMVHSCLATISIEYLVYINQTSFAIGSLGNDVEIWNIDSKRTISRLIRLGKTETNLNGLLSLSDDSLARGSKTTIEIWSIISNSIIRSYTHQSGAEYLILKKLPDERILNGGNIRNFKIFNQTDKSEYQLKEHTAGIKSLEIIQNFGQTISDIMKLNLEDIPSEDINNILQSDSDISACLSNCSNHGMCAIGKNNTYKCACFEHFDGLACEKDLRHCSSQPCMNYGVCEDIIVNGTYTFNCSCSDPFYGDFCHLKINVCENEKCSGNGNCREIDAKPKCDCFKMYSGEHCEVESNEIKSIKTLSSFTSIIAVSILGLLYFIFFLVDVCNFYEKYKKRKYSIRQKKQKQQEPIIIKYKYIN